MANYGSLTSLEAARTLTLCRDHVADYCEVGAVDYFFPRWFGEGFVMPDRGNVRRAMMKHPFPRPRETVAAVGEGRV